MEKKQVSLSQAIEGYFIAAHARRLSPSTLASYDYHLRKLEQFLAADPPFAGITVADIRALLNSLAGLSNKTVLNQHIALSAFWHWGVQEGLVERNIIRDITPPKPDKRDIVPYTKEDIQLMLKACDRAKGYTRPGKRKCDNSRPTAQRDRAILLLLVDTGIRASELCALRLGDIDLRNHHIVVMGKGRKERRIPICARTAQALWRYLAGRDQARADAPLFATANARPLHRDQLRRLIQRAGDRAGVRNAHPHRFRHTFAIQFLRNGGNVFALQSILGHASMDIVKRYLAIAQTDLDRAHQDASPVSNWLL